MKNIFLNKSIPNANTNILEEIKLNLQNLNLNFKTFETRLSKISYIKF